MDSGRGVKLGCEPSLQIPSPRTESSLPVTAPPHHSHRIMLPPNDEKAKIMALKPDRIPDTLLFDLFDCAFGVETRSEEHWKPAACPAAEHVETAEAELGIRLPSLLVDLANQSHYFARYFAELGPNRSSSFHIIAINERLAGYGKPDDLIVINRAYDGDCIAMIRKTIQDPNATPIVYVSLDLWGDGRPAERQVIAPDFRSYLEALCLEEAPRSRVKGRRRRAKRLINAWRGSP